MGENERNGQFRSSVWDPALLILQICAMQAILYSSLGTILLATDVLFGNSRSLDQLFRYQSFYTRSLGGSKLFVIFLINAPICGVALWYVVRRAKQCLDFTGTMYFIHFLICWCYNGAFPTYISWWLLQIASLTITTLVGEYLCLNTEMQAIPLSVGIKSDV